MASYPDTWLRDKEPIEGGTQTIRLEDLPSQYHPTRRCRKCGRPYADNELSPLCPACRPPSTHRPTLSDLFREGERYYIDGHR